MADFFNRQKPTVVGGLNLLPIKDYEDIHQATLQVLEKTGIFVEDQTTRELFGSCGARVDENSLFGFFAPHNVTIHLKRSNRYLFDDQICGTPVFC